MAVITLGVDNFDEVVKKDGELVLLDFFATWCMPCKMLEPIINEVSQTADGVKVAKLDIDENTQIARDFGVMSVPTLVVLKDGQEVERIVGFRQADQILETLNKYK